MSNGTSPTPTATDSKTIAIVSYMTWIGWIIAFVMHGNSKSQLGAYHLRQSLFLHILMIILWISRFVLLFIPFIGWAIWWISWLAFIGLFILWLLGLIAAANGEEKPIPIIGKMAQQMFSGLK